MRLNNKVAMVTGGGSGIGAACCIRMAQEGAQVVVTDINAQAAVTIASEIVDSGGKALAITQDVTDESRWREVIAEVVSAFGSLDVLVNNAGVAIPGTVEDAELSDWQTTLRVNLDAVFMGTREAIKAMKVSGGGSIINMSSTEGIIGDPLLAAYNASKGGVRIFTKSAALHCAGSEYNIRVNSVHPGFIETPMVADAVGNMEEAEAMEFQSRVVAGIPMGALGQPIDVANGVLFLASDESRYMTGSELVIDGGSTAR